MKSKIEQLKVTIHQTKVVSNTMLNSFSLKIKIEGNSQNSDKITEKVFDYNKVKVIIIKEFRVRSK